jgi:hypothetical protein
MSPDAEISHDRQSVGDRHGSALHTAPVGSSELSSKPNSAIHGATWGLTPNIVTTKAPVVRSESTRFNDDFYAWLIDQAATLRRARPPLLDWENLAEELEAMSRSEERRLQRFLVRLVKHLLKWRYQANRQTGSWEASIENSRAQIERQLKECPSLKNKIDELFERAYPLARRKAGAEMGLRKGEWERNLPDTCEWLLATVRSSDFWPEPFTPSTNGTH